MKNFKIVFLLLISILSFTACSPMYYQVYNIESDDTIKKDNNFVFSNEDCEIKYDFWGEGGDLFFIFTNKTDKDICINLERSCFILNNFAHNYYESEVSITRSIATLHEFGKVAGASYSISDRRTSEAISVAAAASSLSKKTSSTSVETKKPNKIWIPANSSKAISEFKILTNAFLDCSDADIPSKNLTKLGNYTKNNSPLIFSNRIVYHFANDSKDKIVENKFWIADYINYNKRQIFETFKTRNCITGLNEKQKIFKVQKPYSFYNVYKTEIDRMSYLKKPE